MNLLEYYLQEKRPIKLNLGCRDKPLPGYINLDIDKNSSADLIEDCRFLKNIPNNSCEEITAIHFAEHMTMEELEESLHLWWFKLKNGGILRLSVPDFDKCIGLYKLTNYQTIKTMLYGSCRTEWDTHKAIYTKDSLTKLLKNGGYKDIKEWEYWTVKPFSFCDTYAAAVYPYMHKKFLCDNGQLIDLGGIQLSLNLEAKK